jgi:hypothetical protein
LQKSLKISNLKEKFGDFSP